MIGAMAGKKPGVGTAVAKPEPESDTESESATTVAAEVGGASTSRFDRGKLIMVGAPLLVAGLGAGLWFTGVLPRLLGLSHDAKQTADAALVVYAQKKVASVRRLHRLRPRMAF